MKQFVRERLEDYLSGTLSAQQEAELESHLQEHPEDAAELALYGESSGLFENLRAPEGVEPAGDFYAHVMQRVEEQRAVTFWMFFLQPAFARRLVFGGLMWLALLGGYVVTFDSIGGTSTVHVAERMLSEPPSPEFNVRLGSDIEQNRNSMLAVLMVRE